MIIETIPSHYSVPERDWENAVPGLGKDYSISPGWYVVCTVMEVICIKKYHRLCTHSMPWCKVHVMVSRYVSYP